MNRAVVLFDGLVSLLAASLLVLMAGPAAVLAIREPARRIRAIQRTIGSLAVLPLVSLVPSYPRLRLAATTRRRCCQAIRGI